MNHPQCKHLHTCGLNVSAQAVEPFAALHLQIRFCAHKSNFVLTKREFNLRQLHAFGKLVVDFA